MNEAGGNSCVFCQIVAGTSSARWVRNEPGSDFVVFHNRLKWERVMLLVVPRRHMTQEELWRSDLLPVAGRIGLEVGDEHCPEAEFRMLSNFGPWAHQSQEHAHLHVISGVAKNLVNAKLDGNSLDVGEVQFDPYVIDRTPTAHRVRPPKVNSQRELWSGDGLSLAARAALKHVSKWNHLGFRLASNFSGPGGGEPGLFLLGGGQLDLYI